MSRDAATDAAADAASAACRAFYMLCSELQLPFGGESQSSGLIPARCQFLGRPQNLCRAIKKCL